MSALAAPLASSLGSTLKTYPLSTGVPFRIIIGGVLCERVSIDGQWAAIDGHPVYMEV